MKFVVTGDNHLRPDRPLCRLDEDWIATQKAQLDFIVDLANEEQAALIITGDLFDVPRVPPKIVSMFIDAISNLNSTCYVIAGNHSLPWHKLENVDDSSIGILKAMSVTNDKIVYLDAEEYTENGRFEHAAELFPGMLVIHTLTFPSVTDIPFGAEAVSAYQLLEKFPNAEWIFTGDYHKNFVVEEEDHIVINPGCMNIQSADMIDYTPVVYVVETGEAIDVTTKGDPEPVYRIGERKITAVPVPENPDVLTRNHLDQQKERDARISSFVETVIHEGQIGLSFEDNLKAAMDNNKIDKSIRAIITEIEEELR